MPNLGQTRSWLWACWMQKFAGKQTWVDFKVLVWQVSTLGDKWLRTCCRGSLCCLPDLTRAWLPFFLSSLHQLSISEQRDHLQSGWLGLCSWPPCSLGTFLHARSMSFCKLQRATADWFQQLCPCVSKSLSLSTASFAAQMWCECFMCSEWEAEVSYDHSFPWALYGLCQLRVHAILCEREECVYAWVYMCIIVHVYLCIWVCVYEACTYMSVHTWEYACMCLLECTFRWAHGWICV